MMLNLPDKGGNYKFCGENARRFPSDQPRNLQVIFLAALFSEKAFT